MAPQKKSIKILHEGLKALTENRTEKALELFTEATSLDPSDTQAWNNRGVALRRLGKITEAIECYNKALAIDPTIIQVLINKARALKTLDELAQASLVYEEVLELEPGHSKAMQELEVIEKLLTTKKMIKQKTMQEEKKKQHESKKIETEKRALVQYLEESQQSITDAVENILQKQNNPQKSKQEIRKDCEKLIVAIKDFDQQTRRRANRTAREFQFYDFIKECQEELAIWNAFTKQMIEKLQKIF